MRLVHKINEVREQVREWKRDGLSVGFVPTMGALHAGHLSLIKKSVEKCDRTVVSIFVNPIQFGPSEDLDKYPRTLDADCEVAKDADLIFAPTPAEMYGEGFRLSNDYLTYVIPPYFYMDKLCGKSRVGHFDGVCTVVNKFFNIVQPDFAFFGEKDRQQLIIIKKMVKDLNIPIEIIGCPIVREESGLALSSRNSYLTPEEKEDALALSKLLFNIKKCYKQGLTDASALKETAFNYLNSHHNLEYLDFRDEENLEEKSIIDDRTIAFIAVKIGNVRLIDNISLKD